MSTRKKATQLIWVVVNVESGVPTEVAAYVDRESAKKQERLWRKDAREEYDAVGLFEVEMEVPSLNT